MNMDSYYDVKLYSMLKEYLQDIEESNYINKNIILNNKVIEFKNYIWKECNLHFDIPYDYKLQNEENYLNNTVIKNFITNKNKSILFSFDDINEICFIYDTGNKHNFEQYIKNIFEDERMMLLKKSILNENLHTVEYREISNTNNIYHFVFYNNTNNLCILAEMTCLNCFSDIWKKVFHKVALSIKGE